MQQRSRRLAAFFGMSALISGGFVMIACGTDNGAPVPTPQVEAGRDTGGKDGTTTENEGGPGPDGGPGVDADCSKAPKLRATPAGGFFCPFQAKDAGATEAGAGNCTTGQTCCSPAIADGGPFAGKFPPSFCANGTGATVCTDQDDINNSDFQPGFFSQQWHCQDKSNCAAGEICVLFTSPFAMAGQKVNVGNTNDKSIPAACMALDSYQMGGTRCVPGPTEGADEIKLCSTTDDTCAPKTCTPFDANNRDLGYCK